MTSTKSTARKTDSQKVYGVLRDNKFHTLAEIAELTGLDWGPTIAARIRELRTPAKGGYTIVTRRPEPGSNAFAYKLKRIPKRTV